MGPVAMTGFAAVPGIVKLIRFRGHFPTYVEGAPMGKKVKSYHPEFRYKVLDLVRSGCSCRRLLDPLTTK